MNPLDKLQKFIDVIEEGTVQREDVVKMFAAFRTLIKDLKESLDGRIVGLSGENMKEATSIRGRIDELERENKEALQSLSLSSLGELGKEIKKVYREIDKLRDSIPTPTDLTDIDSHLAELDEVTIDLQRKIKATEGKIPSLMEVNDKILSLEKELEKEIKRVERSAASRGGGTSAPGVAHAFKSIAHTEQPTGAINGSNTTYTVKNNIWWVFGFTINGEQIAQLPNFTYINKTITFASALPAAYADKDFEIKYIGT